MALGENDYPLESENKNPVAVNKDGSLVTADGEVKDLLREIRDALRELLLIERLKHGST